MKLKSTSLIPHLNFLLFFLFSTISFSQVGIGTTNPNSNALLDVDSSIYTGGILLPRLGLSSTGSFAPLSAHVAGMIVYNTATISDVTPGFYYNNGTLWVRVGGSTATDKWDLSGNSGTNPATNFLGTTDNSALRFRTSNTEVFEISGGNATNRGKLRAMTNGTSALPVYSWNSDPDTGMYRIGTNILGLSTTGTERMRFLANGQVSINNTTPSAGARFTVTGAANEYVINGYSSGLNGVGVFGENTTTGVGVYGYTTSTGWSVLGNNTGTGIGVIGFSSNTGVGIQGQNSGTGYGLASFNTGAGDGIYNATTNGWGIINLIGGNNVGMVTDLTNAGGIGSHIMLDGQDGTGFNVDNSIASDVYGYNAIVNTLTPGVLTVNGTVYGGSQTGVGHGIIITHSGSEGRNAEFDITNASNPDPAIISISLGSGSVVVGQNQSNVLASAITVADFGYLGVDVDDHIGVSGYSDPGFGYGIGTQGTGGFMGVLGIDNSGLGGGFSYGLFSIGDSGASGIKAFTIDHPNDPENKILKHFSVESNEVLNMYRGTEVFDANGKATVLLPDYYDDINKNPSYQLTPIGAAMPNLYIEKEISQGKFVIAGGVAGKKVSWTITAERNDLYLQQNPDKRNVEISKGSRSGKYLMPKLYGQSEELGMFYKERKKYEPNKVIPTKEYSLNGKLMPKPQEEKTENSKTPKKEKLESQEEK